MRLLQTHTTCGHRNHVHRPCQATGPSAAALPIFIPLLISFQLETVLWKEKHFHSLFQPKRSPFFHSCNLTVLCVCWYRGGCPLDWRDSETVSVPLSVPTASKPSSGPRAGFCLHRGHRWHQAQRASSNRAACKSPLTVSMSSLCQSFVFWRKTKVHFLFFLRSSVWN